MQSMEISVDDVELEQLRLFSSVNNVSLEQAASRLLALKVQEWIDGVAIDDDKQCRAH